MRGSRQERRAIYGRGVDNYGRWERNGGRVTHPHFMKYRTDDRENVRAG